MSTAQVLATLFYGALALFALRGTWKRPRRRILGITLFACWIASNVIFWTLPTDYHPTLLPFLDVLFALVAAKVGLEIRSKVPLILISLSVLAMAANAAFSITGGHTLAQIVTYEIALNIIFAAQCLITGGWGFNDEFGWVDRVLGRAGDRGGVIEPAGSQTRDEIG